MDKLLNNIPNWIQIFDREIDPSRPPLEKTLWKRHKPLRCRFCGKSKPSAKFKTRSHVIPKALGNHELFTADECDACNNWFGRELEQHLINRFRVPALLSTPRGRRNKKYRLGNDPSYIEKEVESKTLTISTYPEDHTNSAIQLKIDPTNNRLLLDTLLPPYRMDRVVRAIGRMGLFCLSQDELERNSYLVDWIKCELDLFPHPIFIQTSLRGGFTKLRLEVYRNCLLDGAPFLVAVRFSTHAIVLPLPRYDGKHLRPSQIPRIYVYPGTGEALKNKAFLVTRSHLIKNHHEVRVIGIPDFSSRVDIDAIPEHLLGEISLQQGEE